MARRNSSRLLGLFPLANMDATRPWQTPTNIHIETPRQARTHPETAPFSPEPYTAEMYPLYARREPKFTPEAKPYLRPKQTPALS